MSCNELFKAWPMCSTSVTLGGGIMIVYGCLSAFGWLVKTRAASHFALMRSSNCLGSYWLGKVSVRAGVVSAALIMSNAICRSGQSLKEWASEKRERVQERAPK